MGVERRQYPRVRIPRIRIELKNQGQAARSLQDISRGGMAFQVDRPPLPGSRIGLNLIIPGEAAPLELSGEVVRITGAAVAIRFDTLPEDTARRLGELIEKHRAPPAEATVPR